MDKRAQVSMEAAASARRNSRLLMVGWTCLGAVLGLMCFSLEYEFVLVPPLFLAALAIGLMAVVQTRSLGGLLLILSSLVAPSIVFMGRGAAPAPEARQAPHGEDRVQNAAGAPRRFSAATEGETTGEKSRPPRQVAGGVARQAPEDTAWEETEQPAARAKAEAARPVRRASERSARVSAPSARSPGTGAGLRIPDGIAELPVIAAAPLQEPTRQEGGTASRNGDAMDDGAVGEGADVPEFFGWAVPKDSREVGDVLDQPLTPEEATNAGFWVGGSRMYTDETNMIGTGWLKNASTNTVGMAPLLVLWFDANSNIIATSKANVGVSGGIRPGESRKFGIKTPGDPRIVGYHYIMVPPEAAKR